MRGTVVWCADAITIYRPESRRAEMAVLRFSYRQSSAIDGAPKCVSEEVARYRGGGTSVVSGHQNQNRNIIKKRQSRGLRSLMAIFVGSDERSDARWLQITAVLRPCRRRWHRRLKGAARNAATRGGCPARAARRKQWRNGAKWRNRHYRRRS